ncbi:MAG: ribosomal protein S18-alanine N-acetyltransferase [Clostridiaceae bacterium]|nr:ribosomal protein S18-alanine N-acetyltransferase [Clostridiaceae bacterium]
MKQKPEKIEFRYGLGENDIPQLMEIENTCFSDPWSEATFRSEISSPYSFYVAALEKERVVGYIGGMILYENCDITNVAVLPDMRRRGIATGMLEIFLEGCRTKGAERAMLEVRESNVEAIRLYEGFGFRSYGRRVEYYENPAEDAVLMVVSLC